MLDQYVTDTQNLLQKPGATTPLYPDTAVTRWINIARGQLAGEAECIRVMGTIATVANQRPYNFSDINVGVPATTGIQGILNVRRVQYVSADGYQWIPSRPWPWFDLYSLNNPVPFPGVPTSWAQYQQGSSGTATGSAASGSFYIDPPPDQAYTLSCDCTCYPIVLVDDASVEAIPYQFTDAVPFFAAYYALLSAQSQARRADAQAYYELYQTFLDRGRKQSNPSVNRWQFEQAADIPQQTKLGLNKKAG